MPVTLSLVAGLAARVAADAELRQMRRAHLALLEQRRHQPVGDAAVRRAFAHRINARVGDGLHRVVDDDAAVAVQPCAFCQLGVGADAGGHHHQVGRDLAAVLELHGFDAAAWIAEQLGRLRADHELQAALFERALQQLARRRIELALHQPRHDVHDRHVHATQPQAVGGFEPQQAAADHHRVRVCCRRVDHRLGVGDVAVGDHAVELLARHRQHERVGAGGQQQAIVGRRGAVVGDHQPLDAVDLDDLLTGVQRDAVLRVPRQRVEDDLVDRLLAGQHRAQQDAVVVGVRLGAEHGDVVQLRRDLQQLLERAHAGHAVAHQHQLHAFHVSAARPPEGTDGLAGRADPCGPAVRQAWPVHRTVPVRARPPRGAASEASVGVVSSFAPQAASASWRACRVYRKSITPLRRCT